MSTKKIYSSRTPYVVRASEGVIAESKNALILSEEGQSDRIFFPKSDVAMVLFDPSSTSARDPRLGEAKYFNLAGQSGVVSDVAWSYENADGEFAELANFITFDGNRMAVEAL